MELEEARDILANCIDDYVIAEYCSSCDDKESCKNDDCIFSKAIEIVLNHLKEKEHELNSQRNYCKMIEEQKDDIIKSMAERMSKQEKMIDRMADEILDLNSMIAEKSEFFSVVPMWLGKEHIIEYFKGITNKKD